MCSQGVLMVVLCAGTMGACVPSAHRTLPLESSRAEILVGRHFDRLVVKRGGVYHAPALAAYVSRLGRRLAARSGRPGLPWTFRILDGDNITAHVAPGGFVYVTRGLLAHLNSEAELAALLCHEIGHVEGHHHFYYGDAFWSAVRKLNKTRRRRYGLQAHWGWLRAQLPVAPHHHQLEADELGLRCLIRNGYPKRVVYQLLSMMERIGSQERLDDAVKPRPKSRRKGVSRHAAKSGQASRSPEWRARLAQARRLLGGTANTLRPVPKEQTFMRRLSGLVVATEPSAGVRAGGRYFNSAAGFQIALPTGWSAKVFRDRLIALLPGKPAVMLIYPSDQTTPRKALQELVGSDRKRAVRSVTRSKLKLYRGRYEIGETARAEVAAFRAKGGVFVVALMSPRATWPSRVAAFSRLLGSLRTVVHPVPVAARPFRIRVRRAAAAGPLSGWTACVGNAKGLELVRKINRLAPGTRLVRGQWVKCLVRPRGRR